MSRSCVCVCVCVCKKSELDAEGGKATELIGLGRLCLVGHEQVAFGGGLMSNESDSMSLCWLYKSRGSISSRSDEADSLA